MEFPGFFKVFLPSTSSERLLIPTAFVEHLNGIKTIPGRAFLRNSNGRLWSVEVIRVGNEVFFSSGWANFVQENSLKFGDYLTFDFDGGAVFNFKLFGATACEKGCFLVEEEEEEEEEEEKEKEKGDEDEDVFHYGIISPPKNPYFVVRFQAKARKELYVPRDVINDYKLKLPTKLFLVDEQGRKWRSNVVLWKDGRTWLSIGWRRFSKRNCLVSGDRCICEFIREKGQEVSFLKLCILRAGTWLPKTS